MDKLGSPTFLFLVDKGWRSHPSYVIVDVKGGVLWSATGQLPADFLQAQLQAAVQK